MSELDKMIAQLEAKAAVARTLKKALDDAKATLEQAGVDPDDTQETIAEICEAWRE